MVKDKLLKMEAQGLLPLINGFVVTFVYPDSPADLCGIKAEDIICSFGGVDIGFWDDPEQFYDIVQYTKPGETYSITLMRFENGVWKQKIVRATLIEIPEE